MSINIRLHSGNINTLKFREPQDINIFYFDSLFTCNIKCVYCHHTRNTDPMSEEDFKKFYERYVKSVDHFSLGCGMEPTMDKRMINFARIIKNSGVVPLCFKLQTNGTILHHHDIDGLREAGMNAVCFSFDTIDPEIHRIQRGGSDLNQIIKNIKWIRKSWDTASVWFMATVTNLSLPKLDDLVNFAIDNGINGLTIRNLYHFPESTMLKKEDHEWMKKMLMPDEVFMEKCNEIINKYNDKIIFTPMLPVGIRNHEKEIFT